jgi:hypothetical protein
MPLLVNQYVIFPTVFEEASKQKFSNMTSENEYYISEMVK